MNWAPVVPGTVEVTVGTDVYWDDGNGNLMAKADIAAKRFVGTTQNTDGTLSGVAGKVECTYASGKSAADAVGTVEYGLAKVKSASQTIYDTNTAAAVKFNTAPANNAEITIGYQYNNVAIPQNDLPMVSAQIKAIPLIAKARRVAVYYSQIAAFQAKTDYGFDLGQQLAEKAVGQLSYEIDTEVVNLIDKTAGNYYQDDRISLRFNANRPTGISLAEHYEGFLKLVNDAKMVIYTRTKRFAPNYMIVAADVIPILSFARGWNAASTSNINGPYFAGTLDGLKVYVSPAMTAGRFVLGVNGNDMMSSVAVYAPYMPIVPTQLLQFADGGTSQGWSTLYALEVLNAQLCIAGEVYYGNFDQYVGSVNGAVTYTLPTGSAVVGG